MTPGNPSELFTPFLPTTYDFPKEEELESRFITESFANFADVINDKTIGAFTDLTENFNGEKWAYKTPSRPSTSHLRNGYQAIAYVASLPNTGVLILVGDTFPLKNVNKQFVITHVWGSASKPPTSTGAGDGDFFSFFSEGNSKISFTLSDIQLVITTTTNLSAYSAFFVIQYLRDGI